MGSALLKDVFKTDVYRLAEHLNERAGRGSSAEHDRTGTERGELREDQRDADSISPYDALDPVLGVRRRDRSREELVDEFDAEVVESARWHSSIERSTSVARRLPGSSSARRRSGGTAARR